MKRMKFKIVLILLFLNTVVYSIPLNELDSNELSTDGYSDEYDEDNTNYSTEIVDFQNVNGDWHKINLTESLDDDEMYDMDMENITLTDDDKTTKLFQIQNHVVPKLYLRDDPDLPYDLTPVLGRDAPFDINHPTKVIVHGWLNNGGQEWVVKMKDKYFINGDYNVIVVDWHKWALLDYTLSARKTRVVGNYLAEVLMSLIEAQKVRVEDIHLAGHSLGAHVIAVAGKKIYAQLGKKVGRITGLDPAGPLFEFPLLCSKKKRLTKDDALFVDVIHTDSGILGFKRTVGHADFYPNGGTGIQPGCGLIKNHVCSHLRSYQYYTESINTEKFKAAQCDSWRHFKHGKCKQNEQLSMGFYLDTYRAKGKYYLRTRRRSPFAKG